MMAELELLFMGAQYRETLCKAIGEDYLIETTAPPCEEGLLSLLLR